MQKRFRLPAVICALVALLLSSATLAAQGTQTLISLAVDAHEAPRGILHAQLTIPVRSGPLTLLYPKWIPGEHGPTGPIQDVVGLKLWVAGKEVPWQRDPLDMYAFHCEIPAGAQALEVSLDFLVPIQTSGFTSGASATPFLAVINWNQLLLYPKGRSAAAWTFAPRLVLPKGWKYGTALPVVSETDGQIEFRPVSLERLVDSPLIAGVHFRTVSLGESDSISHQIHMVADQDSQLDMPPHYEAGLRRLVTETGALFGARHYGQYHFLLTLSDHVAHFGLEHHESSDDRVNANALGSEGGQRSLGGLLAHEFVHSWNGKFRRPQGLATADFSEPMDDDLLWVYEGLTEYLGTILAARSGLWTTEELRQDLAATAAYLDHRPGRTWRPLEDTALFAQVLYGTGEAWSAWRRGTDFYDESTLIWLETDVMLRQKSNGRYSLDDFCRRFHGGPGGVPAVVPYKFEDVTATLGELVPYDWKGFFTERLRSTSARAPLGGLEASGWRLVYRETPSEPTTAGDWARGRTDLRFSLGMTVHREGEIGDVIPEMPAARAGLVPGMKVIAVNGRKYSSELLRQAIKEAKGSSGPIELLVEDRDYYQTYRVDYHSGEQYPYLERDSSKPDLLSEIIQPLAK